MTIRLSTLIVILSASVVSAAPGVYRDHVNANWFAGNTKFWYRNALPGGASEFTVVDTAGGTRQPAFDHARLGTALSEVLNQKIAGDHLPVEWLDFESDPGAIIVGGMKGAWRVDPRSYELHKARGKSPSGTLQPAPRIHPSLNGGEDTSITFENRTETRVDLFWVAADAKRVRYASLNPGETHEQQTFAGHVWVAVRADGGIAAIFEATSRPAVAVIGGAPSTRPAPPAIREVSPSKSTPRGPVSPNKQWAVQIKANNLLLKSRRTGEEFELSHDGKPGDGYSTDQLWWSPDSTHLLAMRVEAGQEHPVYTVESSPRDQVQPRLRTMNYLKPGDKIDHPRPRLFDIASRKSIEISEELCANPWSIGDVRWAVDSSHVTFVYNQRGHQALRVISVDAGNGSARAIVDDHSDTFIDYSGKFFCHWLGDEQLIWMSERDGWNHLWLIDAKAGRPVRCLTPGELVVKKVLRVDESSRQILFTAGGVWKGQDPYYTHFCRASLDTGAITVLTEGEGVHAIEWSPDEKYFIDTWSRVDQPPLVELRRGDNGARVCLLEQSEASEALAARGGPWPERFVAKGRDGKTDIYGVIHFPRHFDPSKKYPVVEEIYAGPQDYYTPKSFRLRYGSLEALLDHGIIVVQCDGMGTSGRSKAFHDVCFKNLRDAGFPDRIAWIKAAALKHPQMDLSRVGIYGGSAGGQNAMGALIWHHDFYKVAVADCGCHDNRMDKIWWNEQWMGWPIGPEYAENSNVVNAKMMEGKLMLIFGEMDDNVDPASTMQVVNALEKADKDFELVVVTGAKHGAAETPYGSRRRLEFLTRNLQP